MAKKTKPEPAKTVEVVPEHDPAEEHLPEELEFEREVPVIDQSNEQTAGVCSDEGVGEPTISSPAWTPYVISRLTPEEMFNDKPTVAGLRRVAAELLGDIVENSASVVSAPSVSNGMWATVQARLCIMWYKNLADNQPPEVRVFTGLADVYQGNTDAAFARFPSSLAETRAQGRALVKALHLVRVVSSEETTSVPVEESGADGFITPTQINFIDHKCKQLNLNVMKFICSGKAKTKYASIKQVPYEKANGMVAHLSHLQRNKDQIATDIVGYDEEWNAEKTV